MAVKIISRDQAIKLREENRAAIRQLRSQITTLLEQQNLVHAKEKDISIAVNTMQKKINKLRVKGRKIERMFRSGRTRTGEDTIYIQ